MWHTGYKDVGSVVEVHRLKLPLSMWDLSSLTRDQTHVPCIGRQIPNHWTTVPMAREVPRHANFYQLVRIMSAKFLYCKYSYKYSGYRLISICGEVC